MGKLKREAVVVYQCYKERFIELLWALMYLYNGQLVRIPELLGIQWKNTVYSGVRNIFIEENLVIFVVIYYKRYRNNGNIKIIYQYLSQEIRELLVYYL